MFPQANERFTLSGEEELAWLRERRICHPKCFHRYFQLSADATDVPAALMSGLMKPGADYAELRRLLKSEFDTGAFYPLMDRLRAEAPHIQAEAVEPLVTALLDLSDELPPCEESLLTLEPEPQVVVIVGMLLRRIDDDADRARTLHRALTATKATTAPVMLVAHLLEAEERSTGSKLLAIDRKALEAARDQLLPRLWTTARSGAIWRLRRATGLLFRLRDWAGIKAVREWLSEALADAEVAVAFLCSILQEARMSGDGGETTVIYSLRLSLIDDFADPQSLHDRARAAARSSLETAAVEALEKVIQLKASGKPIDQVYVITRTADGTFRNTPQDQRFVTR